MLFAELAIRDDLKDETYLAAFLSCWLCFFVFPQKRSFLHPGVFRVASLMAACTIYSLAVPVLANIYHGLDWWTTRHETYFEDNRHHLVSSVIPPSSKPRLLKNRVSNLGGKEIRLVEAIASNLKEEVKEHKNESDSSKSDRHWKRPLKKAKVSSDNPDGRGFSALGVLDVSPL
uniref:Aminotransferase-like plant mobile domain-containing protein n=1 Tax=Cucumis melo TaxID=3656 RepID=A0A9I9E6I7_CUCME